MDDAHLILAFEPFAGPQAVSLPVVDTAATPLTMFVKSVKGVVVLQAAEEIGCESGAGAEGQLLCSISCSD